MQPRLDVVVGIVRDETGRVLVNQRRPGTRLAGLWEFPGGKRQEGEAREEALRRELDEELGLVVVSAEPLLTLSHDYRERLVHLDVWLVQEYSGEAFARENQKIAWVEPRELPAMNFLPADGPIIKKLTAGL